MPVKVRARVTLKLAFKPSNRPFILLFRFKLAARAEKSRARKCRRRRALKCAPAHILACRVALLPDPPRRSPVFSLFAFAALG